VQLRPFLARYLPTRLREWVRFKKPIEKYFLRMGAEKNKTSVEKERRSRQLKVRAERGTKKEEACRSRRAATIPCPLRTTNSVAVLGESAISPNFSDVSRWNGQFSHLRRQRRSTYNMPVVYLLQYVCECNFWHGTC
jgi:hypothetical protein